MTCPSCGQDNPEHAAFCLACGSRLLGDTTGGQARKTVTVLFSDLVGSTALGEALDTEVLTDVMNRYFDRMRTVLRRHGGTVEKFIGDAVVAVFGYPTVHEDDPLRALRAAEEMRSELQDLNAELVQHVGVELQTRTGVNTGEVLVGALPPGSNFAAGDVMNTAARMQQLAAPGEILLGEATWRLVMDAIEAAPIEPLPMKGKSEPVPAWRLVKVVAGMEGLRRHLDTPLVGRRTDLDMLIGSLHQAVEDSVLQLVTVVGEPGIGKTRLVRELQRVLDAAPDLLVQWRQGRCLPYGEGVTFWPLGEIVKAHIGMLESDSLDAASAKLDAVLPAGPDRSWLRDRLLPLIGLEPRSTGDQLELFAAWRTFLDLVARAGPTVLVFEDLHWADESMLAFIDHLRDSPEKTPMLVVATTRPELYERRPRWAEGNANATTIGLGPLSETETVQFISSLLDKAEISTQVMSLIVERSEGNPLYAEEFVRLLTERGLLVRRGKTVEIYQATELPAPESIQALIAARLDTLPWERKQMLQDASVIGNVFWLGGIAAMGGRDPASVEQGMEALSRKELIRQATPSSIGGDTEYAFWHILLRDVAYAQIPKSRRVERHLAAAGWLEQTTGDRVGEHAEILAHHYTTALGLCREVGSNADAERIEGPAMRFLILAGERSLGLDVAKAESSFSAALEIARPGHHERPLVLMRWADAVRQVGRPADAARALEEAAAFLKTQGRAIEAARAMTALANVLWYLGDANTRSVAREALSLLQSNPPGRDLVDAYAESARQETLSGRNYDAVSWAQRAANLAVKLGIDEPTKALAYRGWARCNFGDPGGLEDLQRAVALAVDRGEGREAAVQHGLLAMATWPISGPARSLSLYREGIEFCERRGNVDTGLWLRGSSLEVLFDLGSWDEILAIGPTLAASAEASAAIFILGGMLIPRARVLTYRGEVQEALKLSEFASDEARSSGATDFMLAGFSAAAAARLAAGDRDGAIRLLSDLAEAPTVDELVNYGCFLGELVRTAVGAGESALAGGFVARCKPTFTYNLTSITAAEATLTEARGDLPRAASLYTEAAQGWDKLAVVPERALALLGAGRCLLASGRAEEAEGPLRQARNIFAELEAGPLVVETDEQLANIAALSS